VSPVVTMMAVTRGGNHMFGHIINATVRGLPQLNLEALNETLRVFRDDVLSPIYVGWTRGYLEDERQQLQAFADQHAETPITISHPREAFQQLARAFAERTDWLA
jgi:CRISPR-associated protein Cst2